MPPTPIVVRMSLRSAAPAQEGNLKNTSSTECELPYQKESAMLSAMSVGGAGSLVKAFARGLSTYIFMPQHLRSILDRIMATTMEVVLGTMFLGSEKNIDTAKQVMGTLGLV
jgi:hypothetical protein